VKIIYLIRVEILVNFCVKYCWNRKHPCNFKVLCKQEYLEYKILGLNKLKSKKITNSQPNLLTESLQICEAPPLGKVFMNGPYFSHDVNQQTVNACNSFRSLALSN